MHQPIERFGVNRSGFFVFLVFLAGLLSACASDVDKPVVLDQNPNLAVAEFQRALEKARSADVHLLSPDWYKKAQKSAAEAAAVLKEQGELKDIFEALTQGKTQLGRAEHFAEISRKEIRGAYEARKAAIKAGVPELYSDRFENVENKFLDLGRSIEDDYISGAREDSKRVEQSYRQLELYAIKQRTLGEARKLIRQAIAQDAKKLAPRTLYIAQKTLHETDQFITQNRYSTEITDRAENALRKAQHIGVVMSQVRSWSKKSVEDRILTMEKYIVGVAQIVMGEEATRQVQPLENHINVVAERVKAIKDTQRFLNTEVTNLQSEMKRLGVENQTYEQKQAFAAKFKRVSRIFTHEEADVYRQGNSLLIRLKGINFDVGKAYIQPQHYPLLTKLQKAINIFGTRQVIVEGHTDTTGSLSFNKVLSKRRANAVAAYLVINGSIAADAVTVNGYGPEKPIAPNTTAAGRKLNRRIDVTLVSL